MISGLNAIGRLTHTGETETLSAPASPTPPALQATSFAEALAAAAEQTAATLGNAEAVSLKALQGDVDTREVADAVMSAEQSLQAAIAIRDKVVTAYLEISRMQI